MLKPAIKEILHKIDALSDKDRLELEYQLSLRLNREWLTESKKARKIARAKGITQDVIDRIIERRRYGR